MRKTITILGTMLITAVILISGSAVATWVYIDNVAAFTLNVSNPLDIRYDPDGEVASLAYPDWPYAEGEILLDLTSTNAMPNNQDFTVYADSITAEQYDVYVLDADDMDNPIYVGRGSDNTDETFKTPFTGGGAWQYIFIEAYIVSSDPDPLPGPDIDAVGWDKP